MEKQNDKFSSPNLNCKQNKTQYKRHFYFYSALCFGALIDLYSARMYKRTLKQPTRPYKHRQIRDRNGKTPVSDLESSTLIRFPVIPAFRIYNTLTDRTVKSSTKAHDLVRKDFDREQHIATARAVGIDGYRPRTSRWNNVIHVNK